MAPFQPPARLAADADVEVREDSIIRPSVQVLALQDLQPGIRKRLSLEALDKEDPLAARGGARTTPSQSKSRAFSSARVIVALHRWAGARRAREQRSGAVAPKTCVDSIASGASRASQSAVGLECVTVCWILYNTRGHMSPSSLPDAGEAETPAPCAEECYCRLSGTGKPTSPSCSAVGKTRSSARVAAGRPGHAPRVTPQVPTRTLVVVSSITIWL